MKSREDETKDRVIGLLNKHQEYHKTDYSDGKQYLSLLDKIKLSSEITTLILSEQAELRRENEKLKSELERERMRLAGCGVAALGYFTDCHPDYDSASLQDTLKLWNNYIALKSTHAKVLGEIEKERREASFAIGVKCHQHLINIQAIIDKQKEGS